MAKKLAKIDLLTFDRQTVLEAEFGNQLEGITVKRRLGRPDKATLRFISPAAPALPSLQKRRVVRFTYESSEVELWRVKKASKPYGDEGAASAELRPLWMDLDTEIARQTLTNGTEDVNLTITGRSASEALNSILSSQWNAPSEFTDGTVEAAVNDQVALALRNATHLEAIGQIAKQVQGEWEAKWDEAASEYKIHLREQIGATSPGTRVISGSTAPLNRRQLERKSDATEYFSAISPIGRSQDGVITIADARWNVASANYDAGAGETTITLEDEPVWEDGVLTNTWFAGFSVIGSTAPDTITVSGDASGLTIGRFMASAGGDDLTELVDTSAESNIGRRVKGVEYEVSPFANLLVQEGKSANLSSWTSGLPDGWVKNGAPTITEVTDAQYAKHGSSAAKVEGDSGAGLETTGFSLPKSENDLVSVFAYIYLETGSVRIEILDDNGEIHPIEEKAFSTATGNLIGIKIGGASVPAQPIHIRVLGDEAGSVFYVDAVAVTQSGHAYEYQGDMGPPELWKLAADELLENGGNQPDRFDSRIYDRSAISGASEIEIGDKVTVEDQGLTSFEARVVEITENLGYDSEAIEKTVRLDRDRPSLITRLSSGPRESNIGELAPVKITKPSVEAEYFQDGTDGKARLTIADPSGLVSGVEARTTQGEPADTDSFSSVSAEPDGTYLITVPLKEKHNSRIDWRVLVEDPYATVTGDHTFDVDVIPEADYEVIYEKGDNTGEVHAKLRWEGDEDVASVEAKIDVGVTGTFDETHTTDSRVSTVTLNPNTVMEPGDRFRVLATAYNEIGASGTAETDPLDQIYEVPFRTDLAGDYIVARSITERALADTVIASTFVAKLDEPLTTERTSFAIREVDSSQPDGARLAVIDLEGRGITEVVLTDDLDPGDTSLSIENQRVVAAQGSPIVETQGYAASYKRQEADRILQYVEQTRHTRGIGKIAQDYDNVAGVTSLSVEYLTNPLSSGDKVTVEGLKPQGPDEAAQAPFSKKVTVDGSVGATGSPTTIPIQSTTIDVRKGGQVLLPDEQVKGDIDSNESSISSNQSSIASIDTRVTDNEATIVMKASVTSGKITKLATVKLESSIAGGSAITLAADQINIEGSAIFHSGTNLTDATTRITGDKIRTGHIQANNGDAGFDLTNKEIWLNSATWEALGVQIQYNAGSPRMHIGDKAGGNPYVLFENGNVEYSGDVLTSTLLATLTVEGKITAADLTAIIDGSGFSVVGGSLAKNRFSFLDGFDGTTIGYLEQNVDSNNQPTEMTLSTNGFAIRTTGAILQTLDGINVSPPFKVGTLPGSDQNDGETVWVDSNNFLKVST